MNDQNQRDDSAESGLLDPDGGGEREAGGMRQEPAEGSDEILQDGQQGKGCGAG